MASESRQVIKIITPRKWIKLRGIFAVFGGILIHLVLGSVDTYGNMVPYFVSYLRARGFSPTLNYEKASWIVSSNAIFQALFAFIGGMMERIIGTHFTILIGCLLFSGGVALTYFTLNEGFIYALLTYAVLPGAADGMSYFIPLGCAMRWFPNRKGFISGVIISGFGIGAFIFNQIITAFINPQNLQPKLTEDQNYYFSQTEVLDNVPKCMLLLSAIYITVKTIGILLISNPPVTTTLGMNNQKLDVFHIGEDIEESAAENGKINDKVTKPDEKLTEKEISIDMTTMQMLKTKLFYHLWFIMFCNNYASVVIITLYKPYGQTFIHDDYFLSMVGAFASIISVFGRVIWGLLADRTSFQISEMFMTASISCLFSLFNISELGGKVVFSIFVCLLFFSISGTFSVFPPISMKCFGSKHYTANYGLLCTSLAASTMSASFMLQFLFPKIGYHGLFFVAAGTGFIGCVLSFFFREPKNKRF